MSAPFWTGSFSHSQPTLPRLTRLGAPTDSFGPASPPIPPPPQFRYQHAARPSLPSIDTHQLPPLPLPPFEPGFPPKTGNPKSPSLYSSTSSWISKRRSSDGSDADTPPSSRSSASNHSGHHAQPKKLGPWGASPQPMSRKASMASEWSWAPSVNPGQPQLLPRQYGAQKPRSATTPVQAQRPPLNEPPPTQWLTPRMTPHTAPNSPPRHNGFQHNTLFMGSPQPERSYRSSSEPQVPSFRSARTETPQPPQIPRSQSPPSYLTDNAYAPPPLRMSKSNKSSPSLITPGPAMTYPTGPRHAHKTSSVYSRPGGSSSPPPGAFPETPPEFGTPQITPSPPSRPMSPTQMLMTESEINALWSHACLLYHHGKVADAVTMLHQLHQRPGAEPLTMARLNVNIGIMSESLSNNRNFAGVPAQQTTQLMIEAFQAAVKHSPDGPEGALATFLLGCALFDNQDFDKAASCFDMCEAIFGGEKDVMNYRMSRHEPWAADRRPSALEGGEKIDLSYKLGMQYTLHLTMVRENYHVAQERSRIPANFGTNRGLHRIPSGLLIEQPFPPEQASLSPLSESDEDESEMEAAMRRVNESLRPSGSGMELPDIRLDLGSPGPAQPKQQQHQQQHLHPVRPGLLPRRSTKKHDRQELERRQQARRTRILIKLGDLHLNKPLPPLPHERGPGMSKTYPPMSKPPTAKMLAKSSLSRPPTRPQTPVPEVPPLPVAKVMDGMAFV